MRGVRVLGENSGGTEGLAEGSRGRNTSHAATLPVEKRAPCSGIPGPDGGWRPEVERSMLNSLRLVVGIEVIDPRIETHSGHG